MTFAGTALTQSGNICSKFESNPFKKEKCRTCMNSIRDHNSEAVNDKDIKIAVLFCFIFSSNFVVEMSLFFLFVSCCSVNKA